MTAKKCNWAVWRKDDWIHFDRVTLNFDRVTLNRVKLDCMKLACLKIDRGGSGCGFSCDDRVVMTAMTR
jgi:hypothetical protein